MKIKLTLLLTVLCGLAQATVVRFETVLGNFDVILFDEDAPLTVQNFLNYVNDGDYNGSIIHRSAPGFVIQGGGFTFDSTDLFKEIPPDPAIVNEFSRSNVRGTIAMAKLEGNPDSATSQWFINLVDNSNNLDNQNGGFTVFGKVKSDDMAVVDAIAALQRFNFSGPFGSVPLINYSGQVPVVRENFVIFESISIVEESDFNINAGLSGAWFNPDTSAQGLFFEVLPTAQQVFLGWFTYDTELAPVDVTATVGAAGQRWLSAQGAYKGNQVVMDVAVSSNGLFLSNQTADQTEPGSYGTVTVTFTDCSNAIVDFDFPAANQSGQFNIVRIASDNVALCEQLNTEATN
ncbi:peptidylprolyl isomerase [Marinicella sp. W31]|uniref:peptidylprolyl isomerase n=1 Tax=Marinicella sp. W31 TaxID=3023713 RepID=UPI003757B876